MIIADNVLEAALAQVFAGQAAGHRMSFAAIADAWGGTGLRLSDLRDAIREAVDQHHLSSRETADGLAFELTAGGRDRYDRHARDDSPAQWLRQHRRLATTG